ncbi:MAG: porin family protein [Acidobacteria bacterium]|nr:porin family protein [Acidobacteriota bacterium]
MSNPHRFAPHRTDLRLRIRSAFFSAFLVASVCLTASVVARAQEGYYVSFRGGVGQAGNADPKGSVAGAASRRFDDLYFAGGAFGKELEHAPLRVEGEFTYFRRDITPGAGATSVARGNVTNLTGMFNILYDLVREKRVTPYVGGGIGFSDTRERAQFGSIQAPTASTSSQVFAYQIKAGFDVKIQHHVSIGAAYRFFGTGERNAITSAGTSFKVDRDRFNLVEFGVRFHF